MNHLAQLGITTEWWVTLRDVPPVRHAIIRSFLAHWLPIVEQAILANKKAGKTPSNWDQLATAMDRNFASVWRAKSGKVTVSWYDAELMAEILNLRIEQLTPTRQQWLPLATHYMCESEVSELDALAYAEYRMAGANAFSPHLDEEAVGAVLERLPEFDSKEHLREVLINVAERVGRSVEAAQAAAKQRKS